METITHTQAKSAATILEEFLSSISNGDAKRTASFFAEDGYIDAPYVASLGMPTKIVGPVAIEATMLNIKHIAPDFHFTKVKAILETETEVVAEYESEANMLNGRSYAQLYMGHLTIKDGKIVSHREFLNTISFVQAFFPNGLSDLITTK